MDYLLIKLKVNSSETFNWTMQTNTIQNNVLQPKTEERTVKRHLKNINVRMLLQKIANVHREFEASQFIILLL